MSTCEKIHDLLKKYVDTVTEKIRLLNGCPCEKIFIDCSDLIYFAENFFEISNEEELYKKLKDSKESYLKSLGKNLDSLSLLNAKLFIENFNPNDCKIIFQNSNLSLCFEKWADQVYKLPFQENLYYRSSDLQKNLKGKFNDACYLELQNVFQKKEEEFFKEVEEKVISSSNETDYLKAYNELNNLLKITGYKNFNFDKIIPTATKFINEAFLSKDCLRIHQLIQISPDNVTVDSSAIDASSEKYAKWLIRKTLKNPTEKNLTEFNKTFQFLKNNRCEKGLAIINEALKNMDKKTLDKLRAYGKTYHSNWFGWLTIMTLRQHSRRDSIPDISVRKKINTWIECNNRFSQKNFSDFIEQGTTSAPYESFHSIEKCQNLFSAHDLDTFSGNCATLYNILSTVKGYQGSTLRALPIHKLITSKKFDELLASKLLSPEDLKELSQLKIKILTFIDDIQNIPIENRLTIEDITTIQHIASLSPLVTNVSEEGNIRLETLQKESILANVLFEKLNRLVSFFATYQPGDILYADEIKFHKYNEKDTPIFSQSSGFHPSKLLVLLKRIKEGKKFWNAYSFLYGKHGHTSMIHSFCDGRHMQYHIKPKLQDEDLDIPTVLTTTAYRPRFFTMLTPEGKKLAKIKWGTEEEIERTLSESYARVQIDDIEKHGNDRSSISVNESGFAMSAVLGVSSIAPKPIQKKVTNIFWKVISKTIGPIIFPKVDFSKLPEEDPHAEICSEFIAKILQQQLNVLNNDLKTLLNTNTDVLQTLFPKGCNLKKLHPNLLQKYLNKFYTPVPDSSLAPLFS